MTKKPLSELFAAMYHEKYDFRDFASGDIRNDFEIFKAGDRTIYKPNSKLKKYHSFLNLFLFERFRINSEVLFSYRKGVNVIDAVSKHTTSRHFFQTDIENFFQSIDSDLIRKTIVKNLDTVPVEDAENYVDRIVDLVAVDGFLPIGFPTSPQISNACLNDFDNLISKICNEKEMVYTRYADDLIVSSKDNENLTGIAEVIQSLLSDSSNMKMNLNVSKTKFTHIGAKIKLLGLVVLPNGHVSIDIKLKRQIEVLLHFYVSDRAKYLNLISSDFDGGTQKISGYLSYINTVDKTYLDKLRKKYGSTVVDMFLHYGPIK